MFSVGTGSRAAVNISSARAEASGKNGASPRGPKTEEGRDRCAQKTLKQGMRGRKFVVLRGRGV